MPRRQRAETNKNQEILPNFYRVTLNFVRRCDLLDTRSLLCVAAYVKKALVGKQYLDYD